MARYGEAAGGTRIAEWQADSQSRTVQQRLRCSLPEDLYAMDVRFANGMRLIGYDLQPDSIDPGSDERKVRLSLFWQGDAPDPVTIAGNRGGRWWSGSAFDTFVHLTDGTAVWQTANRSLQERHLMRAGGTLESIHELAIPQDLPAGKAYFEVGLYYYPASADARIAIINQEGQPVGDMVTLGGLMIGELTQSEAKPSLAVDATFKDHIELSDLRLEEDKESGQIQVVLGWRGLDRPSQDYTAFVHLVDQGQAIVAQRDQPPGGVGNPTHLWAPNEMVRTSFTLQVPVGVELGDLALRIGLYDPLTGERLHIMNLTDGQAIAPDGTYLQIPLAIVPQGS